MKTSRISIATLVIALAVAVAAPGVAHARKIKCGSVLGPGGTYILDRDLTCVAGPPRCGSTDPVEPCVIPPTALVVTGGATLNLNGHVVTCVDRATMRGIDLVNSTLKNGTVRGCREGVAANGSVVKNLVLDGNDLGVRLNGGNRTDLTGTHDNNLISGTTAMNGIHGFSVVFSSGNTLVDNIAQDNDIGFNVDETAATLISNLAIRNRVGFFSAGAVSLIGNRAEHNAQEGYLIAWARQVTGNLAKKNTGPGFIVGSFLTGPSLLDVVRHNVAEGNGDDGFVIDIDSSGAHAPATLANNYAVGNRGTGLRSPSVSHSGPPATPTTTITGNTALGNGRGDLSDEDECRWTTWKDNIFRTRLQDCIH